VELGIGTANERRVRRATGYVDRILKGKKPADLRMQTSTKFELYPDSIHWRKTACRGVETRF
jgi:hypothetical protein